MSVDLYVSLNETNVLFNYANAPLAGSDNKIIEVKSGSRMLVTLKILSLDPGASVNLLIKNGLQIADITIPIDTINYAQVGYTQRVYSDFNSLFSFAVAVTGGNAQFVVGVSLADNMGTTTVENADLQVDISAYPNTEGRYSSVRVSDGVNEEKVNSDGSTNVVIEDDPLGLDLNKNLWAETPDEIPAGVETSIQSYTVPPAFLAYLQRVEASGENIADYNLYLNGDQIRKLRTWMGGELNVTFDFTSGLKKGYQLKAGDVLELKVIHIRPSTAFFDCAFQLIERAT